MKNIVLRHMDFDAGHRVARHLGQCHNLHGHRYRITVRVAGPIKEDDSDEHGMIIDFGKVKQALMAVHDEWDHKFLIGDDDPLKDALKDLPGIVYLPLQPTAENLARLAYGKLSYLLAPLAVLDVTIQETASCSAVYRD